ncbi:MAG: hypothetical protein ACLQVM_27245 [Terriglobia bacterium]
MADPLGEGQATVKKYILALILVAAVGMLIFLLVKGLLFYEQSATTFGVESWTVPANVQVATQVHQLPSP